MSNKIEISPSNLEGNVFELIGKDWALVSAGDEKACNTMTVSWGGLGVLWNKNVATIYVRPQRYTYEFIEKSDYFTVSFFEDTQRESLTFCGKNSGRDCDKIKECGLTPIYSDNTVTFDEARITLVCKKIYFQDITPDNFLEESISKNYPLKDYHRMYVGEIVKVIKSE